jgi:cyclophilin family peptidyl-prolyl cis-trans isomerase
MFGQVIEGQDVVGAIEAVKKDGRDMPLTPVIIEKLEIKRVK